MAPRPQRGPRHCRLSRGSAPRWSRIRTLPRTLPIARVGLRALGAAAAVAAALAPLPRGAQARVPSQPEPARAELSPVEIFVCESHHRALLRWVRAANRGRLPRRGVTVVHFDAHPDLAVPKGQFSSDWRSRALDLLASADIATFQLAAVGAGLVKRVLWLRPSWAHQLPDGERRFALGVAGDGRLRVDDPSDYYVLDDAWAPSRALGDPVPVGLRVLPLGSALDEPALAADGPVVLDIDLDGFATRNPAADRLRRAGLDDADVARLRAIFEPRRLVLAADPPTRIAQLEETLGALDALASLRWRELPAAVIALWRRGLGVRDLFALYRILSKAEGGAPIEVLLEYGREVVGLPEHRADPREIARTAALLGELVASGSVRPTLVTVARSVQDGFTPAEAWPEIERALLAALGQALGRYTLRFDAGLSPVPGADGTPALEPSQ